MDDRGVVAIAGWFFVSIAVLAVLFLLLRSRAGLPARLIGLGVVLALAAAWFGLLTGLPLRNAGPGPWANPALAEGLLRLAAVMVLGGVVVALLVRNAAAVPALPPEHPRDVPPSV